MSQRTCTIGDCERPHDARGMCAAHWKRWKRTGDPGSTIQAPVGSLQERVLSRVVERDMGHSTPCWISDRATQPNGYTKIGVNGQTMLTHRVAYIAFVGPIPDALQLDHLCRNRACCNPAHLEPVTNRVNLLRGEGFVAMHAVKTHCPRGHSLDGANLYLRPDGKGRDCRACRRAASQRALKRPDAGL